MSIKCMTRVWDYSTQKGSRLLLMLAIADYAHDDGTGARPSTRTLARKTRMSQQNVLTLINRCEESGELAVVRGRNRNPNSYVIQLAEPTAKKILAQELDNSSAKHLQVPPLMNPLAKPNYPSAPKTGAAPPLPVDKRNGRPTSSQQQMYEALVRVCLLPTALLRASDNDGIKKLKAQVGKVASTLVAADYTAQDVLECYSRNGWWFKEHWQGKDGEAPSLGSIPLTIEKALAAKKAGTAWSDPAFVSRADKEKEYDRAQREYQQKVEDLEALAQERADEERAD